MISAHMLGASLYIPATHDKLAGTIIGTTSPRARSVIVCTEDSILVTDLQIALQRIREILGELRVYCAGPLRFIRPRNPDVLEELLRMPGIERIHGFVIPKADHRTLPAYLNLLNGTNHLFMPTIETDAAFDTGAMIALRNHLSRAEVRDRCLAIRIGGNDLLRLLGMRRPLDRTIYDTPIGALIPQLVMTFKSRGFNLTGPVMDQIDSPNLLLDETKRDKLMGLEGKSAIHPCQIDPIESVFRVTTEDLAVASEVLTNGAPAVF